MSQVWIVPGALVVTLQLYLTIDIAVGLETIFGSTGWLVWPVFGAVFVTAMVSWAYSPLPDGTTFGGTYGTGWGFGHSD